VLKPVSGSAVGVTVIAPSVSSLVIIGVYKNSSIFSTASGSVMLKLLV